MRNKELRPFRERVIGAAEGRLLEIGVGFWNETAVLSRARAEVWRSSRLRGF